MNPLVSIMIATYNQPDYIVQAVSSCVNQDYENIEVVVGDDSTNDEVYNALLPFFENKKVKYFRNPKNLGRTNNYKKLLFDYAVGDWAIMLDGDDYYIDKSFLSKSMKYIIADPSIVLVAAGHLTIDENENKNTEVPLVTKDIVFDGKEVFYKQLRHGQHSANIYNRKLAIELDFYRLDSMAADAEGLFRIFLHGKIVYLKDIVVIWRLHSNNNTFRAEDAIKQMHEMIFIDNIYQYSLDFIDSKTAKMWRKSFYKSMSHHIIDMAKKSNSFFNVIRVSIWASEFWGFYDTFLFLKTYTYRTLLKQIKK